MREWPSSAARWIRRLISRDSDAETNADAGNRVVSSAALAVLALESMACTALCRQADKGELDAAHHAPTVNAFGKPVEELHYDSARATLASACGLAMTGTRGAVFLSGDRLAEVHDQLFAAAGRRLPVVIHAACRAMPRQSRAFGSGHEGYHAVAGTGAFLVFARNAQHAADLTLAARRLAELSLTPGVVAMDGPETATAAQDLSLPSAELVSAFLKGADDDLEAPTGAQRLLFGQFRRTVPRWFDLDRPTAFGTVQAGDDYGVGSAGRRLFFDEELPELAAGVLKELSRLTGRPLGFVHTHRMEKARHVIVAQGSMVELAEAVADHLAAQKQRVGVLSVDWLRPFPNKAVRTALAGVERVTVLERADDPLGQSPPLMHDIKAALNGGPALISGIYGVGGKRVTAGDILSVCDNMTRPEGGRTHFFVGMAATKTRSGFPKRQVLLDGVNRAYPDLDNALLAAGKAIDLRPEGAYTVSVHCQPSTVPEDGLTAIAEALSGSSGHVRSRSHLVAHRAWTGLVTVCDKPLRDLGDRLPVDVAFISSLDLPSYVSPVSDVTKDGAVVLSLGVDTEDVWDRLPASWQTDIRKRRLNVFNTTLSLSDVGEQLAALRAEKPHDLEPVAVSKAAGGEDRAQEPELPHLVKRIDRSDTEYDNPSRFWGEVVQPRMMGEAPQAVPDPYLAIGAVPARTATFRDATASRTELPVVDATLCTGCGKCWTACPDSSLGPVAIQAEALLTEASRLAQTKGPVADKLRRSHKALATRLNQLLQEAKASALSPLMIREAFSWLVDKGTFKDEEQEAAEAALTATLAVIESMPMAVTEVFFSKAEAAAKGSGTLFLLGVNPQTCQGCTSCVINCPDDAIAMVPQTPALLESARDGWRLFEHLPEPSEAVITSAREEIGLAAVLLTRDCQLAVAGGSASEPGSGARLASRLVAGAVEYDAKRRLASLDKQLERLSTDLRVIIKESLSGAVAVDDLSKLGEVLASAGQRPSVGAVSDGLEERGEQPFVDAASIKKTAELAMALEAEKANLSGGPNGVGRARMGLVVTAGEVGEWAARFPHNPFYAPLAVDLGGDGAELAVGLQHGLLAQFTELFRKLRRAQLRLKPKADLAYREWEVESMTWRGLSEEERATVPPLLLLADAETLGSSGLSGLSQILSSDLPIRVVLLDRHAGIGTHVDPTLMALAHRRAFVVSGSIAYPEHLFDGVLSALAYAGPALIHVVAPSPARDGFSTGTARDRARLAVETRVHPLLTYDPGRAGVFGARMDLSANPMSDSPWVTSEDGQTLTPAHWAAGHNRAKADFDLPAEGVSAVPVEDFISLDPEDREDSVPAVTLAEDRVLAVSRRLVGEVEDRLANWTTLQELAGVVTPFTQQVRAQAEADVADERAAALAAVARDYEAKLVEARSAGRASQVAQLRQRLMFLAGFADPTSPLPEEKI